MLTCHSYDGQLAWRIWSTQRMKLMTQGADIEDKSLKGLIPRIVEQIFQAIVMSDSNVEYTVKVSYMEIYMEKIKDLLARKLFRTHSWIWHKPNLVSAQ